MIEYHKYFSYKMYEINDGDILVATDIGPQKKSAMIMDNFYKDTDSVR